MKVDGAKNTDMVASTIDDAGHLHSLKLSLVLSIYDFQIVTDRFLCPIYQPDRLMKKNRMPYLG